MPTAKETMADLIAQQPEDSSYDDLLRELAYARMVQRGLDDADAGRLVQSEEIRRKIESWRK